MTINRTTLLNLPLPVTGTESGTWGDTTNNGLTQYMDIAIAGMTSLTSSDFTAGALTISNTSGDSSATNIAGSSAQYNAIKVSSLAVNSTITAPSSNRRYVVINADSTYTLTIKASGQTGFTFRPGQSGIVAFNGTDYAAVGVVLNQAQTFTAAQTFRAANAIKSEAAATQDAVIVAGRSGGTSSYSVTLTPTTLSASRTFTLPDLTGTAATIDNAQTFTAAQTFRAANAVRSEAASTQDAVVLAGRAGGTSSYAVTLTPTTLSSSTTLTLPNATDTVAVIGTAQTFTAAQTFRAANAIRSEAASTQDAVVIAGRAGGTSSYAVTLTPTTLSANRTLNLPDASGTILQSGTAVTVAQGGTGLTSGTSGGIPYFSSTSAIASSGLLSANQFVIGGGAGIAPTSTTTISWSNTFTAAQTFRAANAIRSEAASTQDAVVIAGRAGGTSSYAVTLTPATLSASRTVTFADGGGDYTVGYRNAPAVGTKTGSYTLAVADVGKYVQVGSGGSITIPNSTFAEGDVISIFNNTSGAITITCSTTTAYIAGIDSSKASVSLETRGVATVLFISGTVCVITGNVS